MKHRHTGKYKSKTPKGNVVYKHKPTHKHSKISKRKRKIFTAMARQPYEMGGDLDFENGDLDNAKVYFGNKDEVEFPYNKDRELKFHTHVPLKNSSGMPSYEDILSMKETDEKEQIIFHKRIALSIAEDDKFQRISNKKLMKVSNILQRDYDNGMTDMQLYKKYKPIFRKELGLDMTLHKPNVDIKLKSRSV